MLKDITTPKIVTELKENEVFVFGSNMQGEHIGGAALCAFNHFGAVHGEHVGMTGDCYAIPTVDFSIGVRMPKHEVEEFVKEFIIYADNFPDKTFLVTPIGCGIAGFTSEEIAPMFEEAINLDNVKLPKEFWEQLKR